MKAISKIFFVLLLFLLSSCESKQRKVVEIADPVIPWGECEVFVIRWFDREKVLFKNGEEIDMEMFVQRIADAKKNGRVGVHIVLDVMYSPKELERLSRDMHFFADFFNVDECQMTYGPNSDLVPRWGSFYNEGQEVWGKRWASGESDSSCRGEMHREEKVKSEDFQYKLEKVSITESGGRYGTNFDGENQIGLSPELLRFLDKMAKHEEELVKAAEGVEEIRSTAGEYIVILYFVNKSTGFQFSSFVNLDANKNIIIKSYDESWDDKVFRDFLISSIKK